MRLGKWFMTMKVGEQLHPQTVEQLIQTRELLALGWEVSLTPGAPWLPRVGMPGSGRIGMGFRNVP